MKYDDIIYIEKPEIKHERMPEKARAVQFAPFAALTGYSEAIGNVGVLCEEAASRYTFQCTWDGEA